MPAAASPEAAAEPLSRDEFIREQNELYKRLRESTLEAGHVGFDPESEDLEALLKCLRLYVANEGIGEAALIEEQRQLNDYISEYKLSLVRQSMSEDHEAMGRRVYSHLAEMRRTVASMLAQFVLFEERHRQVAAQNNQLKIDYARELSRRVRLEHAVRKLGTKLVAVDADARTNRKAQETLIATLNQRISELEMAAEANSINLNREPPKPESLPATFEGLQERLGYLHAEISELHRLDIRNERLPDQPQKLLARILQLVDSAQAKRNATTQKLLRSWVEQVDARDGQLSSEIEALRAERDIAAAKAAALEAALDEQRSEVIELHDRMANLVQTLKSTRPVDDEDARRHASVLEDAERVVGSAVANALVSAAEPDASSSSLENTSQHSP